MLLQPPPRKRFGPGLQAVASVTFLVTRLLAEGVRLFASRCPDCGLDTVVDYTSEPEQVWTLDESDYGDAGSAHL